MNDFVGYAAGFLVSITMIPQIYKSIKYKKTNDVSLGMLIIFFISMLLWVVYGFLIENKPLIIFNGIATVVGGFQLYLKIKKHN
jgi:MtN3 and saliva related transmembrane protein